LSPFLYGPPLQLAIVAGKLIIFKCEFLAEFSATVIVVRIYVELMLVCVSVKPVFGIQSSCLGSSVENVKPVTGITAEIHPAWVGRSIAGPRLRLVEFSAFLEQQLQPDTDSVLVQHLFTEIPLPVVSSAGTSRLRSCARSDAVLVYIPCRQEVQD